jgi:23S rRNA (guanosine2251-2'-O)-methyltransferase
MNERSGQRSSEWRGRARSGGDRRSGGHRSPATKTDRDGLHRIYGHHSVLEALRNPARRHRRLVATENAVRKLTESLGALPLEPVLARPGDIGRQLPPDAVHQGVLLITEPLAEPDLESLSDSARIVVLDQVTDPHNVGAILRTAAAFGVAALLTTERHSPEITGVLAKAASGAIEHVPIIHVRNLGAALEELGARGFLRIGLDSEAETDIAAVTPRLLLALVLGAEGRGLRQRTRSLCDHVVRLSLPGAITSLNVSNAAAIALYALSRQPGG